jgi:hypothetical protein
MIEAFGGTNLYIFSELSKYIERFGRIGEDWRDWEDWEASVGVSGDRVNCGEFAAVRIWGNKGRLMVRAKGGAGSWKLIVYAWRIDGNRGNLYIVAR